MSDESLVSAHKSVLRVMYQRRDLVRKMYVNELRRAIGHLEGLLLEVEDGGRMEAPLPDPVRFLEATHVGFARREYSLLNAEIRGLLHSKELVKQKERA